MIDIPLGKAFEVFIDWLKDSFRGFFDFVQAILDFSINALERILLLDHSAVYPALIIAGLVGLLVFLLTHRLEKKGLRWGLAAAAAVLFAGAEIWRYSTLEESLSLEEAAALANASARFRADLQALAPGDFARGAALLEQSAGYGPDNEDWQRDFTRLERRFDRLRDNDFDRAGDLLEDLVEAMATAGIEAERTLEEGLMTERRTLLALTGIQEAVRLEERFADLDEEQRRYDVLNGRTYEDTMAYIDAALASAPVLGASEEQVARWQNLRRELRSLAPDTLASYPLVVLLVLLALMAYLAGGWPLATFSLLGFFLIASMGFWDATMETLALVIASTIFALLIGVPAGIWSARSRAANSAIRPLLDFMQTMPAFVYLIPAVFFFGLGRVPGAIATLIFAMPPAVRLTALGIRQVPKEVIEAAEAFGATPRQLLIKAQLPIAMPTILAGLNQTIMLALSMVVIGAMIGAGGLGEVVLRGIDQMNIDVGFEGGVSVVILAIYLDRITQKLGASKS